MGNSVVRAGQSQLQVGGGDKAGKSQQTPYDPDTGGYSPVAGFDPQQAYLQQQQKNAAVQAADNLSAQVTSEFRDFDFSLSLNDGDVSNFFQNEQTRNFLADRAFAGDGLDAYRAGLAPGIFDNAIYPQSRGLLETAGSYLYNGAQIVGGVTKYLGDTFVGGVESVLSNPVGALRGLNSTLEGIVDTAYAGTIDVFARQFGLGNGAFERTAARFDSLTSGALGGIGGFQDSIAYNVETGNFIGLGENLGAGLLFGATLASPRGALSGFGSTSKMSGADWAMVNADRLEGVIPQSYYDELAVQATRNPDSSKVVLGKFLEDGKSYTKVGAHYEASYFKLDNWREVNNSLDDMWPINEAFLDQQIMTGKEIILSHDPLKATGYFKREVNYLTDLGYKFEQDNWVWKAGR